MKPLTKTPAKWRQGQTIFNFLEWLAFEKGITTNQNMRMADPFYLSDDDMLKYYKEFIELSNK